MVYRFGVFEFDSDVKELRKNGRSVAIERQPARALTLLVSRAGELVTRDELRDAVWGKDTHVDFDRGLAYCVSQIRTALGDSGDNPRFVQTIPRQGFKFIAPIDTSAARAGRPPTEVGRARAYWFAGKAVAALAVVAGIIWAIWPPSTDPRVMIAVSVFDNETGNAGYDRPVAGLSDLVVEHLSKVAPGRVFVIGNAAVLRQPRNIRNLRAVADGTSADYALLGQLQRGESGLRFITHFIRLQDEAHLKANRLPVSENLAGLEDAVVQEFDRAVREHVLNRSPN
jgi:DNA-binding winged helix-turn-helix (wHTH) protein/TolB-like protein